MTFLLIGGAVVLLGATGLLVHYLLKHRNTPHPSQFTSPTRQAVRPLREAASRVIELSKTAPDSFLAKEAAAIAQKAQDEAFRLAAAREQLAQMSRDPRAEQSVAEIDRRLADATNALNDIAFRLTQTPDASVMDDGLESLVARLENLGASYDEAEQTLNVRQ